MRSYGQYCAVARALDVIGDRWNLLIVRELLLRGALRYTDLLGGLPGIATNLLADRLRELERANILLREEAPPPIATTLFRLTPRGEELRTVVVELGRWGVGLMAEPVGEAAFRSRWLELPVAMFLSDSTPDRPPVAIELHTGEEPMTIETVDGEVRLRPGSAAAPDLVISGGPQLVLGVLSGGLALSAACEQGLRCDGDPSVLARLQGRALAG